MENLNVILTTKNALANEINAQYLADIEEPQRIFDAKISGVRGWEILNNSMISLKLKLKKGAQIMFIKNNPGMCYVNGTLGTIMEINAKGISVMAENGDVINVQKESWKLSKTVKRFDIRKRAQIPIEVIEGEVIQYPLILAWAFTIHKSQGLTFEKMIFDNSQPIFACGQLYVALSRCRTLEGITLIRPLTRRDVRVDNLILEYWSECELDTLYLRVWDFTKDMPYEWEYEESSQFEEFSDIIREFVEEFRSYL